MNIVGASNSTPKLKRKLEGARASRHEVTLDFYAEPPQLELSLDEFEEFALSRLKVSHSLPTKHQSIAAGYTRHNPPHIEHACHEQDITL